MDGIKACFQSVTTVSLLKLLRTLGKQNSLSPNQHPFLLITYCQDLFGEPYLKASKTNTKFAEPHKACVYSNPGQGFGCFFFIDFWVWTEKRLLLLCENSLFYTGVIKVKQAISKDKQAFWESCLDMIGNLLIGMFNFPLKETR